MDFELDPKRADAAYEALVKYLAASPRSEKEARDKLYEKSFHKNEVEFAIDKAKGYRYIDDEAYVSTFLLFNKSRYGIKKLSYKLINEKGIQRAMAENMIADAIDDDYEFELAHDFAAKYAARKKITDKSGAQKVAAFLYQKGFEWNVINKAVSSLFDVFDD